FDSVGRYCGHRHGSGETTTQSAGLDGGRGTAGSVDREAVRDRSRARGNRGADRVVSRHWRAHSADRLFRASAAAVALPRGTIHVTRTRIVVALACCMSAVVHAQVTTNDFARGAEIHAEGASLFRVALSDDVYLTATRPDLGDVRVLNASGQAVPHTLRE